VILAGRQEFEESGRRLVLSAPALQVERLLSITGLTGDGLVFDSVEDAAAA
jgi:anti-anti-sigma regulatory factor